jgi:hypothetical protein
MSSGEQIQEAYSVAGIASSVALFAMPNPTRSRSVIGARRWRWRGESEEEILP